MIGSMLWSIHPAQPEDAERLADLGRETFIDTYMGIIPERADIVRAFAAENFTLENMLAELADPKVQHLLLRSEGQLLGYTKTIRGWSSNGEPDAQTLELARLYLRNSARGQGFGQRLLDEVIDEARRQKMERLWLAVFTENLPAIGFYVKNSFERFGEREFKFDWKGQTYTDQDALYGLKL